MAPYGRPTTGPRRCKRGKRVRHPFEYSAIEELLILSKSLFARDAPAGPAGRVLYLRTQEAAYPGPDVPGQGGAARAHGLHRLRRAGPELHAEHLRGPVRQGDPLRAGDAETAHEDLFPAAEGARTRWHARPPVCPTGPWRNGTTPRAGSSRATSATSSRASTTSGSRPRWNPGFPTRTSGR